MNVYGGGRNGNVNPATLLLSAACRIKSVEKKYKSKIEGMLQKLLGESKNKSFPQSSMENRTRILQTSGGEVPPGDLWMLKIATCIHQVLQQDDFTGCDTLSARLCKSYFSYEQQGSVSCTPWYKSGQMCSGNKCLSQATGSCALLVWLSWHNINSTQFHP